MHSDPEAREVYVRVMIVDDHPAVRQGLALLLEPEGVAVCAEADSRSEALACAAALATLDVLENGGMQNCAEQGAYMLHAFAEMATRHPSIGDVRGKGLMIGVEFVQDKVTKMPDARIRNRIVELAFEHGLLIMGCGGNSMRIIPPLTVRRDEVDEALEIFEFALKRAEEESL